MAVCGISPHHGNTESSKSLEQNFIFQSALLLPQNQQTLSFDVFILVSMLPYHVPINSVAPLLTMYKHVQPTVSFAYQWSCGLLPSCFNDYFRFTSSVHLYSTRQSSFGNLYVTSVNTTQYGLRSLKFTSSQLWNSLPTSITKSTSLKLFCKTVQNFILNFYSN